MDPRRISGREVAQGSEAYRRHAVYPWCPVLQTRYLDLTRRAGTDVIKMHHLSTSSWLVHLARFPDASCVMQLADGLDGDGDGTKQDPR